MVGFNYQCPHRILLFDFNKTGKSQFQPSYLSNLTKHLSNALSRIRKMHHKKCMHNFHIPGKHLHFFAKKQPKQSY
jgi:hypothetical protein